MIPETVAVGTINGLVVIWDFGILLNMHMDGIDVIIIVSGIVCTSVRREGPCAW